MLKKTVLLLFLVLSVFGFSQGSFSKHHIGAYADVYYSYRFINREAAELLKNEKPMLGGGIGLTYQLTLNEKWALQSGVGLNILGDYHKFNQDDLQFPDRLNELYGFIKNEEGRNRVNDDQYLYLYHSQWFIEVPLLVTYSFSNKTKNWFASGGPSLNYYIGQRNLSNFNTEGKLELSEVIDFSSPKNTFLAGILLQIGYEWSYVNGNTFQLALKYDQKLMSPYSTPVKRYYYGIGISGVYSFGLSRR